MSPLPSRPDLKAACALLEAGSARGTGFLVSADRLLTCNHVVRGAGEGPILATFSHGQYEARVELVDAENDCALLRLLCPVPTADAQPLTLATVPVLRSAVWEGYGFPAATGQAGLLIDGRVQDPEGRDPALQLAVVLQSANVTAGSWLAGFSGSPALVDARVIGQMRQIIPDESGRAQMAVVYACPAGILVELVRRRLGASAFSAPNPYRGLASFQPEDAPVFLGRERLTLAGLLPALQARPVQGRQSMRFVICKPGDRPVESLARALVAHLPPDCEVLPSSRQIAIEKLLRDADAQGVTAATLR